MADHTVDLLVIGAGASGATLAFEAVQRGLSVALLEGGDIGGGTSCRSTKLLHGGVRYLELAFKTLDIAQLQLVREALLERAHWLDQARSSPDGWTWCCPPTPSGARPITAPGLGFMTL